ncbi:MAG TPA: TetR/AcrR family transcriptional regulator C-terminal domain-containing protein [Jiangellaceae bacterium]|nr:TetR/AcrR family transcriptional regulator C-terminal domain-containing protein [Jiangellaceae bacterium]
MARPPRRLLSREQIVATALELIDADGLDEFSTRKLAAALGVRGPSLYNYFATKEDILHAVANAVTENVDISMLGRDEWTVALRGWARSYRTALLAHPHIVPFLALGPGRRPAALAMADAVFGVLVDAGWPASRATKIGALMRYFVAGSALGSFAMGFPTDPDVYGERYPHLGQAHLLTEHHRQVDEGAFEMGLSALIEGLRHEYERTVS